MWNLRCWTAFGKAVGMGPTEVELVRLGHTGRKLTLGVTTVAVMVALAMVKPWPTGNSVSPVDSARPQQTAADTPLPVVSRLDPSSSMCANPDGWRIAADDGEMGPFLRTWHGATVQYSVVPPIRSTVPLTWLISSDVRSLVFCLPADASRLGTAAWSGTLWRQGGSAADPMAWQPAARLTPAPGSLGAMADPITASAPTWPPGRYMLEARFEGSESEAWLGLLIQAPA